MNKYKRIKLKDGTTRDEHRIIMENYLGRKLRSDEIVHHRNGNGKDNRIENLELQNRSDHTRNHMIGHALSIGEKNGNSKFTNDDIFFIRHLLSEGMTCRSVAEMYNIDRSYVSKIKRRVLWKNI